MFYKVETEAEQAAFLEAVRGKEVLALDTETTGLMPYHGDKVFAITISDGEHAWYFDTAGKEKLPHSLLTIFGDKNKTFRGQNIKFDLHQLWCTFSLNGLAGEVWDTAVGARLEFNDHFSYSLDACVERLGNGLVKSNAVEEYIAEHNLWEWEVIPGKKVRRKKKFFDKVPFEIMFEYACQDALITHKLGMHQVDAILAIDQLIQVPGTPKLEEVAKTESALVPVITDMENFGVRADQDYCEKAITHYSEIMGSAMVEFEKLTGQEYKASPKLFEGVFSSEKEKWTYTKKGNPSFESDTLKRFDSAAAEHVLTIRNAKSRIDFFSSFLFHSDSSGFVHPSFNSGGTSTGRFSSSEPNFQNLTNDDENESEKFPVRRAIVPPDESYCLVSFDYKQQEYALMLDYAGEMELIEQVKAGTDVHQATADLMGVSRQYAKTLNFMLLYGGGVAKLAAALNVSLEKARELKNLYFQKLPKVQAFIQQVMSVAERRGYVYNWAGRRYFCENSEFSYTMPNRVIQGGGADIMKRAMVRIHKEVLPKSKSTMALTIHDELVFNMHREDLHLIPAIKKIMEEVYPHKHLPLKVSVEHSWKSLGDMEPGEPSRKHPTPHSVEGVWDSKLPERGRELPRSGLGGTAPSRVGKVRVEAPAGSGKPDPGIPRGEADERPAKENFPNKGLETMVDSSTLSKILACYGLPPRTVWSHHNFEARGTSLYATPRQSTDRILLATVDSGVLRYHLKAAGVSIPG